MLKEGIARDAYGDRQTEWTEFGDNGSARVAEQNGKIIPPDVTRALRAKTAMDGDCPNPCYDHLGSVTCNVATRMSRTATAF